MLRKFKHFLNRFYIYRYLTYKIHKNRVVRDPRSEANRSYYPFFKKSINWDQPEDLIEKIFWLQLNSDTTLWTEYADKYRVRAHLKQLGYENHLPLLYGKWDDVNSIDYSSLPKSFVLKTNNGCGTVMVVRDKSKLNFKNVNKQLDQWLAIPYGYRGAQLHYTRIKPCIIAEELLISDEKDKVLSPNSLIDYKVYCINGEPECIWVPYDRTHSGVKMTLFDLNWKKMSQNLVSSDYYTYSENNIPKPHCLEEMLHISKKLSANFPQVRIDFYVINNRPIIGELTFTTGWGWFTTDYYKYLGSKLDLNQNKALV